MDTRHIDDIAFTAISQPLHDLAGERLHRSIKEQIRRGSRVHVVDLRELPELDSHTLGVLIRVRRLTRDVGGSVGLIVDQPNFLRILSITGLDRVFSVFATQAEARAVLGAPEMVPA